MLWLVLDVDWGMQLEFGGPAAADCISSFLDGVTGIHSGSFSYFAVGGRGVKKRVEVKWVGMRSGVSVAGGEESRA